MIYVVLRSTLFVQISLRKKVQETLDQYWILLLNSSLKHLRNLMLKFTEDKVSLYKLYRPGLFLAASAGLPSSNRLPAGMGKRERTSCRRVRPACPAGASGAVLSRLGQEKGPTESWFSHWPCLVLRLVCNGWNSFPFAWTSKARKFRSNIRSAFPFLWIRKAQQSFQIINK